MNFTRPCLILLVLFLPTALAVSAQEPQSSCGRLKVPPSPNAAGPFVVKWGTIPEEKEKVMAQIRSFLWECLRAGASGRVQVTFGNLEGDPTTHTLSILRRRKKQTILLDNVVALEGALLPPGAKPKRKTFVNRFCTFERIDSLTHELIPESETRPPNSFNLHLKNCKKGSDLVF